MRKKTNKDEEDVLKPRHVGLFFALQMINWLNINHETRMNEVEKAMV